MIQSGPIIITIIVMITQIGGLICHFHDSG